MNAFGAVCNLGGLILNLVIGSGSWLNLLAIAVSFVAASIHIALYLAEKP